MMLEDIKQLMGKGHLATETGYYRQSNGKMVVAILTRVPGCKAILVEWWFKVCFPQVQKALNSSNSLSRKQIRIKQPFSFDRMANLKKHLIEGEIFYIKYDNIFQYIEYLKKDDGEAELAICGDILLPGGTTNGHVVHLVRDVEYGCELRSRYWIDNCSDADAMKFMDQNIEGLGILADFLRSIVEDKNPLVKNDVVMCKYCYSEEVIKYGKRKNKQYWLCKKCGHFFVNNKAPPKMKYPLGIVTGAVHDYTCGRSLNDVCAKIEKDMQILPSNSSIYRWINKFST